MEERPPVEEGDYRLKLAYVLTFDLDEYEKHCQACQGRIVYDDHSAELVCSKCGFIVRDKIETPIQTINDQGENFYLKVHNSPLKGTWKSQLYNDLSMKDHQGKWVRGEGWDRIRLLNKRTPVNAGKEKGERNGAVLIQQFAGQLSLTQPIVETALHLFIKVNDRRLCKGRSTANFALAAIYHACRMHNAARTWQELTELVINKEYHVDKTQPYSNNNIRGVKKAIRIIEEEFSIKCNLPSVEYLINRVINEFPEKLIGVNKRDKILRASLDMYIKVKDEQIMIGKNPQAIAAACIYIACLRIRANSLTQLMIGNLCRVSIVSLRKRCNDVFKVLNLTDVPSIRRERLRTFSDPLPETRGNGHV